MLTLPQVVAGLTAIAFATAASLPAQADSRSARAPQQVVITDDSLEMLLFSNNLDVTKAISAVVTAKNQVESARAALIPAASFNLGAVISANPMVIANAVSCLVPFLFPSAWLGFDASKKTAQAEALALHIAKLNAYAAAHNLITRVAGDAEIYRIAKEQFARLDDYVQLLQGEVEFGKIPRTELTRGEAEVMRAKLELSNLRQLVATGQAEIFKLLGIKNPETQVTYSLSEVAPSMLENLNAVEAIEVAKTRAPERRQIDLLVKAAESGVTGSYWSFLQGCSGSQGGLNTMGAGAINMSTGTTISFGYDNFVRVAIARQNVKNIELKHDELDAELQRNMSATLAAIGEIVGTQAAPGRLQISKDLIDTFERLLEEQQRKALIGQAGVKEILDAFAAISSARASHAATVNSLTSLRIALRRLALEDRFFSIYVDSRKELELSRRKK